MMHFVARAALQLRSIKKKCQETRRSQVNGNDTKGEVRKRKQDLAQGLPGLQLLGEGVSAAQGSYIYGEQNRYPKRKLVFIQNVL